MSSSSATSASGRDRSGRIASSALIRFLAAFLVIGLAAPLGAQDLPPLPRERPADDELVPVPGQVPDMVDDQPVPESVEPARARVYQTACPAVLKRMVEARMLPPLAEDQCGARSPLAVTGLLVNGRMVPVSSEVVLSCAMASLLPEWAADVDGYLAARENTGLARVLVGTSYSCRNRNNADEGALSEHSFANAIDVIGFELEDGRSMQLPDGWTPPGSPAGRLLRFAHEAACARFTTALGPEANADHSDHLHLDLGCHGAQCTARICQ